MLRRLVLSMVEVMVLVAATFGAGCSSRPGPPPPSSSAAKPAPTPAPAAPAPPARVPSFKKEIEPYLALRCANDFGCHGVRHTRHSSMDLRAGEAFRHLVNVPSDERRSAMLVAPGDPDKSFLVDKLYGRKLGSREGTAMPRDPDDDRPVSPIPFDPDFLEQALLPWIRAGAPNN